MVSPALSSDEGEIVEATSLPRSGQNGDVDRPGRHQGRYSSRTPDRDLADGPSRRSRSPRGWKRSRDDHRDRRDPRQFRVHYEGSARDERRPYRDLDRPPSRGTDRYEDRSNAHHASRGPPPPHRDRNYRADGGNHTRGYERDRRQDGYPDKRARTRSRSPRGRVDKSRRDGGHYGADLSAGQDNRSGVTATKPPSPSTQAKEPEPDMDWDPDSALDREAAEQAEIERRRQLRAAALKRALDTTTPTGANSASTPASASTRQSTPALDGPSTPASPGRLLDAISPGAFNFADDQALINAHARDRDVDGPSAADYDPTVDMKEDERRDEMRHSNVGLHGELRVTTEQENATVAKKVEDDDDFDIFAEDFAEKYAAPTPPNPDAAQEVRAPQLGGRAGILDGDDQEGYYKIRPGELLDGRYQVSTTLGRGMFSGVARAVDITTQRPVAIKIMRNNDALRKGGFTEISILEKLNSADPDDKKHIVRFERSFEYHGHLCMVFENLNMNLREVLKKFGNNVGINLHATRAYAYQIFLALHHMRDCHIIHADLKPDNILVNEKRNTLKICDLGTAIDRSDAATVAAEPMPYLVSRFYRAPEIILGVPFDYAVDMWSIGCTLYELYTGKILFTGESNNQMLKNIMEIRGPLSAKLYRRGQLAGDHFDEQGAFVSVERDRVTGKTVVNRLPTVKPTRDLRARLLGASAGMDDAERRELNLFVDLLERCLTLNPDKRLAPGEALRHPFFGTAVASVGGRGRGQGQAGRR